MTQSAVRKVAVIMGIPFDILDMDGTVDRIDGFVQSGKPHFVATANVNFVAKAYGDPEFMDVVRRADLITADGMPIVWASRWLGAPLPERVTGADLVPRLLRLAEEKGYTVFFLGGQETVGKEALARLEETYPKLKAHHYSPEFSPLLEMGNDKIRAEVRARQPQMLFVSLGAGKAEKWIRMNLSQMNVPVSIGVGATIDFLAGKVRRSPAWMQRVGLEWLFRLMMEPKRLASRYGGDFFSLVGIFLPHVLHHALSRKGRRGRLGTRPETEAEVLSVTGRLDAKTGAVLQGAGLAALNERLSVVVDFAEATFVDSAGMGALVALEKAARERDLVMVLAAVSDKVMRTMEVSKLQTYFRFAEDAGTAMRDVRSGGGAARVETGGEDAEADEPVALQGRVDTQSAERVKQVLMKRADKVGSGGTLTIDLGGLEFIDSTGLTVFVLLQKKLVRDGAALKLVNVPSDIMTMFKVARVDRFFGLGGER